MEKTADKATVILVAVIFLILAFILFWDLGLPYLTNWDEAWYADIARNMINTGNLITPVWNKESFFDKPPLYFWLSALVFKSLGISEFSARFFSAISGLGVGIIIYFLTQFLFNKKIAILSLIIFSSTIGFLYRARTGNLEALLTFFILLSIFSFYKGHKALSRRWFLVMGISLGLGFLTKGAIIFIFPILAMVNLFLRKEHRILSSPSFWGGIFLGVIIPILWISISWYINGQEFIRQFFLNQTEKWLPSFPFWQSFSFEYVGFIKSGLKLWFIFLPPSLILAFYSWRKTHHFLLLVYFILIFILLSFSENKSNWFIVPIYPIVSIIIGYSLYKIFTKFLGEKLIPLIILVAALTAIFQNVIYKNEYKVPDVAGDEARIALAVKNLTTKEDVVYLTNYYYPTTVYYSERKTYAVYSEHEKNVWWIRPKTDWINILRVDRVFIITTDEEFKNLNTYFSEYKFQILYQSGTKKLLKKV